MDFIKVEATLTTITTMAGTFTLIHTGATETFFFCGATVSSVSDFR